MFRNAATRAASVTVALVALMAGSGCATASPRASAAPVTTGVSVTDTLATGLTTPWGLAFLPDGSALVSERDTGRVKRVPARGGAARVVGTVSGVRPGGEGGLLGLAVPPGPNPSFVFAYFTGRSDNRVVRIAWNGTRLGRQKAILTGIPKASYHDGGRLLATEDELFVATGDAGDRDRAQDRDSLAGKILRVTHDGRPAPGNPFRGSPVYSLGHRNVQGLALDGAGRLWASEFGEKDVDELNLILPGGNYGWPIYEGAGRDPAYLDPKAQWSPTAVASPSGLAVLGTNAYVASLRGQTLYRVPLRGERALRPQRVAIRDLGRLRTVAAAPDGSLWLVTSNTDGRATPRAGDDRIVRLRVR